VTETEQWANDTCERIMASGHIRLYRDLYKDLRERLPCGVACRLIREGLWRTREHGWVGPVLVGRGELGGRTRAITALRRLERYADVKEWGECCGLYDGADKGM
jgi:hypothetical protein